MEWWRYFPTKNPQRDWTVLTPALYAVLGSINQSIEEFSAVLATDNPDLSAVRDAAEEWYCGTGGRTN
jgi:hypothetical protein